MKLEAFKALHGIEQLELTKELMIGLYTSTAGTEVYSIHHEGGWMDNGDGTL